MQVNNKSFDLESRAAGIEVTSPLKCGPMLSCRANELGHQNIKFQKLNKARVEQNIL